MRVEVESICQWQFDVEGNVLFGTPHYFSHSFGNWLPGEPTEVEGMKVFSRGKDVTEIFSDKELENFEKELIEEAVNQRGAVA